MDHSVQNPVINFIDEVNKQNTLSNSYDAINNDPNIKLRRLGETKQQGKELCMYSILSRLCSNSIPEINGRIANTPDLDKVVRDYVARRTNGQNIDFYVKEAIKRNPKNTEAIKNIYESVNKIVDNMYIEKELHPETITDEDYSFSLTPEVDDKLTAVIRDNNLDSLSDVIKDNVRNNAITEVELAKKEREDRLALEEELMNDDSITTESALEEALRVRGLNERKFYTPSLFEAVMNSKFKEMPVLESIGDIEYECESEYLTEGVLKNIVNKFTGNTEEAAKAAIEKNHTQFLATIEKMYTGVYSQYRSKVSPINTDLISKSIKKIMSDSRVGNVTFKSKVNMSEVKEAVSKYKENTKTLFAAKKLAKFDVPKNKKAYSANDAVSEMITVVGALDTYFAKPDVKSFVNKASAFVTGKASKCDNAKDVNVTYKLAIEYYMAELSYYAQGIEFVASVSEFAKKLMSKYSNDAVKEAAFDNAIVEYTMLNISKALYLESFGLMDLPKVIRSYE